MDVFLKSDLNTSIQKNLKDLAQIEEKTKESRLKKSRNTKVRQVFTAQEVGQSKMFTLNLRNSSKAINDSTIDNNSTFNYINIMQQEDRSSQTGKIMSQTNTGNFPSFRQYCIKQVPDKKKMRTFMQPTEKQIPGKLMLRQSEQQNKTRNDLEHISMIGKS